MKELICSHCGKYFKWNRKKKYCSDRCAKDAINKRQSKTGKTLEQIRKESIKRHTHICKVCDKEYYNKRKGKEGSHCCSRECGLVYVAILRTKPKKVKVEYSKVHHKECSYCSKPYYAISLNSLYCSDRCRSDKANRLNREKYKPKEKELKECLYCGSTYFSNKNDKYCDQCKSNGVSKQRTSGSHYQRARRYGVKYEYFNVMQIFERDKWTCQLCGCQTPKELRSTMNDNAPELDHIIPISKGGEHTKINTQCSCRVCNILKGDTDNNEYLNQIK